MTFASGRLDWRVRVRAADHVARLSISDGNFRERATAWGELDVALPPGVYQLDTRVGQVVRSDSFLLVDGEAPRAIGPGLRVSGQLASLEIAVPPLVLDSLPPIEQPLERSFELCISGPAVELHLLDEDGRPAPAEDRKAGLYRLCWLQAGMQPVERTVVVHPHKHTLVWMQFTDERAPRCIDMAQMIVSSPEIDPQRQRATELLRLLLRDGVSVPERELKRCVEIGDDDAMGLLFVAAIGATMPASRERDEILEYALVRARERAPLIPDLTALGLALGERVPDVAHPPLLRATWSLIVAAAVKQPQLVAPQSLAGQCARELWSTPPWLTWSGPLYARAAATPPDLVESMARLAEAGGQAERGSVGRYAHSVGLGHAARNALVAAIDSRAEAAATLTRLTAELNAPPATIAQVMSELADEVERSFRWQVVIIDGEREHGLTYSYSWPTPAGLLGFADRFKVIDGIHAPGRISLREPALAFRVGDSQAPLAERLLRSIAAPLVPVERNALAALDTLLGARSSGWPRQRAVYVLHAMPDQAPLAHAIAVALGGSGWHAIVDRVDGERALLEHLEFPFVAVAAVALIADDRAPARAWIERQMAQLRFAGVGVLYVALPGHNPPRESGLVDRVRLSAAELPSPSQESGPWPAAGRVLRRLSSLEARSHAINHARTTVLVHHLARAANRPVDVVGDDVLVLDRDREPTRLALLSPDARGEQPEMAYYDDAVVTHAQAVHLAQRLGWSATVLRGTSEIAEWLGAR